MIGYSQWMGAYQAAQANVHYAKNKSIYLIDHIATECTIIGTSIEEQTQVVQLVVDETGQVWTQEEDHQETVNRMWTRWWCDEHDMYLIAPARIHP